MICYDEIMFMPLSTFETIQIFDESLHMRGDYYVVEWSHDYHLCWVVNLDPQASDFGKVYKETQEGLRTFCYSLTGEEIETLRHRQDDQVTLLQIKKEPC